MGESQFDELCGLRQIAVSGALLLFFILYLQSPLKESSIYCLLVSRNYALRINHNCYSVCGIQGFYSCQKKLLNVVMSYLWQNSE
jgi:hypothetical protein